MSMNMKRGLAPAAAVAACCCLAACGSSSSSSSSSSAGGSGATTTAASSTSRSADRTALVACLKKHGVTLPSRPAGAGGGYGQPPAGGGTPPANGGTPPANGGSPPANGYGGGGPGFFGGGGGGRGFAANPKLRAAFQACGGDRFRGRFGGGSPANSAPFKAALTKYVACVRQHGYNLPNPNLSGKGPVFPSTIRTNPKFEAASKSCQSLLARPGGAPGSSSAGSSGSSSSSGTSSTSTT